VEGGAALDIRGPHHTAEGRQRSEQARSLAPIGAAQSRRKSSGARASQGPSLFGPGDDAGGSRKGRPAKQAVDREHRQTVPSAKSEGSAKTQHPRQGMRASSTAIETAAGRPGRKIRPVLDMRIVGFGIRGSPIERARDGGRAEAAGAVFESKKPRRSRAALPGHVSKVYTTGRTNFSAAAKRPTRPTGVRTGRPIQHWAARHSCGTDAKRAARTPAPRFRVRRAEGLQRHRQSIEHGPVPGKRSDPHDQRGQKQHDSGVMPALATRHPRGEAGRARMSGAASGRSAPRVAANFIAQFRFAFAESRSSGAHGLDQNLGPPFGPI